MSVSRPASIRRHVSARLRVRIGSGSDGGVRYLTTTIAVAMVATMNHTATTSHASTNRPSVTYREPAYPGPRSPRPGRALVIWPFFNTICPFTNTYSIPAEV